MATIPELLRAGRTLSVEFFPPKTPEGRAQLDATLAAFEPLHLSFVSVTYGAGGSNRDVTREIVVGINDTWQFPAMPHLTCIGHARAELEAMLDDYAAAGIGNVLALAGDPPADGSPAVGDFTYASELVELVRARGDMAIGVAAFPETHPRSVDRAEDRCVVHLRRGEEQVRVELRPHVEDRPYTIRKGRWAIDVAEATSLSEPAKVAIGALVRALSP